MIRRFQYRCSFKLLADDLLFEDNLQKCKDRALELINEKKLLNASFYRYENMGFLYVEELSDEESTGDLYQEPLVDADELMVNISQYLKPWPEEKGDVLFAPMINVYYHHVPESDIETWEYERTTSEKNRVGRVAFVYPDKLSSYIMHHKRIVDEGLLKGDKYAYISLHENLLFSYYEEPRNNINISGLDEDSKEIKLWMAADPESHFDQIKGKGSNFLVIPCLFSIDRIDTINT